MIVYQRVLNYPAILAMLHQLAPDLLVSTALRSCPRWMLPDTAGSCTVLHIDRTVEQQKDGDGGNQTFLPWLLVWNIFYFSIYWE